MREVTIGYGQVRSAQMQIRRSNRGPTTATPRRRAGRIIRLAAASILSVLVIAEGSAMVAPVTQAGAQTGSFERYAAPKTLTGPGVALPVTDVATDGAGDVFMASNLNNGNLIWKLPAAGGVPVSMYTPSASLVAVDAAGDIYTAPSGEGVVSEQVAGTTSWVTVPLTGVLAPGALALDHAGDLFVVDTEGQKVVELKAGTLKQVTLPFTGLQNPDGVAVDSVGDVYVTDGGLSQAGDVVELAAGSSSQVTVPFTGLNSPRGVAVDTHGNIYEADADTHVTEISQDWSTQSVLPFTGLGANLSIATDGSNDVLVGDLASHQVLKLAPGALTANPLYVSVTPQADIAIDSAGDTFVPDFSGDRVIELEVGTDTPIQLPFTGLSAPSGVAVDSAGDVFVSELDGPAVVELPAGTSTQITLPIIATSGATTSGAQGVAVDSRGDVFAILNGNRVVELAAGSSSSVVLPFPTTFTLYSSISADGAGDVVVSSDNQLAGIDQDLELTAGSTSPNDLPFTGLTYPGAVALDSQGNVFASGGSNTGVFELLSGTSTPITVPEVTGLRNPEGLAVASTGTLDIANFGTTGSVVQYLGLGPASLAGAPTNVTLIPGDGQATVTFSPPTSDGGFPITSYTVSGTDTTTPTNIVVPQTVSAGPITFTGLVNGDFYTFSVAATTALGQSASGVSRPRAPGSLPGAPSVSAMKVGNGIVTVTLSPSTVETGLPTLFYTVEATNETDSFSTGQTVTSVLPTVKMTGLLNGDTYTFSATASSEVGVGPASTPTVGVDVGAPNMPKAPKAKTGSNQAIVTFASPSSTGLAPVVSYTVSAVDLTNSARGGQSVTGTKSPLIVTGLTAQDSYSFFVTPTNSVGVGLSSAPSIPVTINQAPQISSGSSDQISAGVAMAPFTVTDSGYPLPTLKGSGLPTGLHLVDNHDGTATISGTALGKTIGLHSVTITATNKAGKATQAFSLTVGP
jgi:Fibronectin type III domain